MLEYIMNSLNLRKISLNISYILIWHFVRSAIVERVVVGDENNPYTIEFIFKNKDEINLNAVEYIMKSQWETIS